MTGTREGMAARTVFRTSTYAASSEYIVNREARLLLLLLMRPPPPLLFGATIIAAAPRGAMGERSCAVRCG
jgi:hypothetical protein